MLASNFALLVVVVLLLPCAAADQTFIDTPSQLATRLPPVARCVASAMEFAAPAAAAVLSAAATAAAAEAAVAGGLSHWTVFTAAKLRCSYCSRGRELRRSKRRHFPWLVPITTSSESGEKAPAVIELCSQPRNKTRRRDGDTMRERNTDTQRDIRRHKELRGEDVPQGDIKGKQRGTRQQKKARSVTNRLSETQGDTKGHGETEGDDEDTR